MRDLHRDVFPTFSAIDIGVTDQEKIDMLDEVMDLPPEVHHFNDFRGCTMVSIYNGGGLLGGRETGSKRKGVFDFSAGGKMCPTLMRVCREKIFSFMDPPGRVTILKTAPNTGLNVHIDTTESEIGNLHQKYRLVLNGNVGKLYFIDRNYNKVYVPPHYDSYSMDGGHPHSIDPDEESKEFRWHTDEDNLIISRLLIPLVYDEDYYIEFKETGNRIYFEEGYAYHWNTMKIHRWSFDYHKNIKNRTCIVVGFSPWLELNNNVWTVNKHFNRMHPTDMILNGDVI